MLSNLNSRREKNRELSVSQFLMKTFWKTINIFLVVGILAIGLLLLGTLMPIPGNFKVKIVKSGSMEPAIRTGSIVVIKPEATYHVGDIVTFGADTKTQIPTTHRIIDIGDMSGISSISTKGDANNAPDQHATSLAQVHGKVLFTLPFMGYLLDFARKPIGFALLVGLPAFAVIVDELGKILNEIKRLRKKKDTHDMYDNTGLSEREGILQSTPVEGTFSDESHSAKPTPIGLTPWVKQSRIPLATYGIQPLILHATVVKKRTLSLQIFIALLLPVVAFLGASTVGNTVSYYSDVESTISNFLRADPLGFRLSLLGSSQVDMSNGAQYVLPIFTPNEDSEPIQYAISSYLSAGDITLCGLLEIEATSTFSYSGPLLLLSTGMSTATGALPIRFALPAGYSANENTSCFIDLIFVGRNANAGVGEGYSDIQRLSIQFFLPSTPLIIINATKATPLNSFLLSASSTEEQNKEDEDTNEHKENTGSTTPVEGVTEPVAVVAAVEGGIPGSASSTPETNL